MQFYLYAVENDLILREKVSEMFTEPHKYFSSNYTIDQSDGLLLVHPKEFIHRIFCLE